MSENSDAIVFSSLKLKSNQGVEGRRQFKFPAADASNANLFRVCSGPNSSVAPY